MSKKKILFVVPGLYSGGIRTSFLNLINQLESDDSYNIDVLMFSDENKSLLPHWVNIIEPNDYLRLITTSHQKVCQKSKLLGFLRNIMGAVTKIFGSGVAYKFLFSTFKQLKGYDYAISFAQSGRRKSLYGGMNEFVLKKVDAKEKITFLHCDYEKCGINDNYSRKIYEKFDKIAAVSIGVKDVFLKCLPELRDKVTVVHNCHQCERINELSTDNTVEYQKDAINFLTVARISAEKGHNRVLNVLEKLKKEGYRFFWHVVGGANSETEAAFLKSIDEKGLSDCVKLYGNQTNPYRFFVNADALLVASYHEAAPMVYSEAEILGLPVITTETISSKEFIEDKNNGFVCKNDDNSLYEIMKEILDSSHKLNCCREALNKECDFVESKNEFIKLLEN
ncbi:MAG: glycosyltransferase [Clostridia bacterium]|nr:glycosyltransferase [Clostridia bacterium]